jgi:hypothetical protein
MADDSGANLMFQFWLERESDGMKRYQKIKRRQRPRLASIERKCDTI